MASLPTAKDEHHQQLCRRLSSSDCAATASVAAELRRRRALESAARVLPDDDTRSREAAIGEENGCVCPKHTDDAAATSTSARGDPESSGSEDPALESRERGAKRQRKARIPTYYLRKEEKTSLELQVQLLQSQVKALEKEAHVFTNTSQTRLKKSTAQMRAENEVHRDTVLQQQLSFASIQSAFSAKISASPAQLPFETCIELGTDWIERHATLLDMKDTKLENAQQYMAERRKFLDPSAPFAEFSRFNTSKGDLRALRFDITPFEGVESVQQVFDALLYYAFNMEISISEVFGDITIREDEGNRLQGISHNRFISNVRDGIQVEINTAMFCKLYEASGNAVDFGGGRPFAVIVGDFVNEDELYPYSPATRLRHDVTAALAVTLEPRNTVNKLTGEAEEEFVVVLTRAAQLSLRKTGLPIPAHVMQDLRARIEGWGDAMLKILRGILYPEMPPPSTEPVPAVMVQRLEYTSELW